LNFVIHCLCATFYDKYTVMRLREFTQVKEAPVGSTTAIGGALATGVGKLTGLTIDYIQKFFSWKGTRDAKKKAKKEKELHKSAAKMNPKEKDVAKNVVSNPQSQEYKDAEAKWRALSNPK